MPIRPYWNSSKDKGMFSLSIAPPYRTTQMYLQHNYSMRIQHVTSVGLLSCSVSPFINQHLYTTLCTPTHTSDSALTRFSVYWWCKQILKRIRAETTSNMWVGKQSVVHKCWLLHGDIRWLDHFTNRHIITYEKSQNGRPAIQKWQVNG